MYFKINPIYSFYEEVCLFKELISQKIRRFIHRNRVYKRTCFYVVFGISDTSDTISHIIASIKVFLFSFLFFLRTEIGKMLSDVSDIIIMDWFSNGYMYTSRIGFVSDTYRISDTECELFIDYLLLFDWESPIVVMSSLLLSKSSKSCRISDTECELSDTTVSDIFLRFDKDSNSVFITSQSPCRKYFWVLIFPDFIESLQSHTSSLYSQIYEI